jgi:hypothetical protein
VRVRGAEPALCRASLARAASAASPASRAPDASRTAAARSPGVSVAIRASAAPGVRTAVIAAVETTVMSLRRLAWLVTVLICAVASLVLVLSGYQGYAAVVLAVGLSAAINLR